MLNVFPGEGDIAIAQRGQGEFCKKIIPHAILVRGDGDCIQKFIIAVHKPVERRDWRMRQDLGHMLIRKARPLYAGQDLGIDLDNTVYALDSITIELSLTLFPWADFRKTKSAIKMHTQTDLRGSIPTCALIGPARPHDVL